MAREQKSDVTGADWFEAELDRGKEQAKTGETVNADARKIASDHTPQETRGKKKNTPKPAMKRVNKGFHVEEGRARAWDILVAKMKSSQTNKKTGPELIDEAIDYIVKKYDS